MECTKIFVVYVIPINKQNDSEELTEKVCDACGNKLSCYFALWRHKKYNCPGNNATVIDNGGTIPCKICGKEVKRKIGRCVECGRASREFRRLSAIRTCE